MFGLEFTKLNPLSPNFQRIVDVRKKLEEAYKTHALLDFENIQEFRESIAIFTVNIMEKIKKDGAGWWSVVQTVGGYAFGFLQVASVLLPAAPYVATGALVVNQVGLVNATNITTKLVKHGFNAANMSVRAFACLITLVDKIL
jgi:hypothetical protein